MAGETLALASASIRFDCNSRSQRPSASEPAQCSGLSEQWPRILYLSQAAVGRPDSPITGSFLLIRRLGKDWPTVFHVSCRKCRSRALRTRTL